MSLEPQNRSSAFRLRTLWDSAGMLIVFLLLFLGCCIFVPSFKSWNNMTGLALSVTTVGIISCTMLFCMAAGDFDLSIGSTLALSGVVSVMAINAMNSFVLGLIAGLAAGAAVGLLNGFIIAQLGINALIATLATMQIVRGISYKITDDTSIGISNPHFDMLGNSQLWGFSLPVWIMVGCWVIFGLLLHKTVFGRNSLAVGGNYEAARLAGISARRTKIIIFTLQGIVAGFAGIIQSAQMSLGQPSSGQGLELQVIAACVLGGVSLTGGVGTILAAIAGALIMGTVQDAMDLKHVGPYSQYIVSGSILLAAVLLDRLKQRGERL